MADQGYADKHGTNPALPDPPASQGTPGHDLLLPLATAGIGFAAGGAAFTFLGSTAWSWSSPFSLMFLTLALFCAGIATTSFALSQSRDTAAKTATLEIEQTRRYAALLLERAELLERNERASDVPDSRARPAV